MHNMYMYIIHNAANRKVVLFYLLVKMKTKCYIYFTIKTAKIFTLLQFQ